MKSLNSMAEKRHSLFNEGFKLAFLICLIYSLESCFLKIQYWKEWLEREKCRAFRGEVPFEYVIGIDLSFWIVPRGKYIWR